MPQINPDILRWARETAGYSPEEAVERIGLREARGRSPVERLMALEAGDVDPTRTQLTRISKEYRRPLVTFYMAARPIRGDRGEDYRTLPDARPPAEDARVDALLRDVRARQSMVRALLEEDEVGPLAYVGAFSADSGIKAVVAAMHDILAVDDDAPRKENMPQSDFDALRSAAENAGVFVLLIGNLGSHHTAFDTTVFRGFALADPIAPFIVINDQDARQAWAFTLLHEFAHILIGASGVSGSTRAISGNRRLSKLEMFCNDVASEFLLPTPDLDLLHLSKDMDVAQMITAVSEFSEGRNISSSMVVYRLFRSNKIDRERWLSISRTLREFWLKARADRRIVSRKADGGPSYYTVKRHRVGAALIALIRRTLKEGAITPTKAGKVLGVKPANVDTLIRDNGRQFV